MSSLTREEIYDQDFQEETLYADVPVNQEVPLPLTKLGFEALLQRVVDLYKLPGDDASRSVLAGYIHHIPNEKNTVTLDTLGKVLHKSVANNTSWKVDQEVKEKRRKELEEAKLKAEAEENKNEEPSAPLQHSQ